MRINGKALSQLQLNDSRAWFQNAEDGVPDLVAFHQTVSACQVINIVRQSHAISEPAAAKMDTECGILIGAKTLLCLNYWQEVRQNRTAEQQAAKARAAERQRPTRSSSPPGLVRVAASLPAGWARGSWGLWCWVQHCCCLDGHSCDFGAAWTCEKVVGALRATPVVASCGDAADHAFLPQCGRIFNRTATGRMHCTIVPCKVPCIVVVLPTQCVVALRSLG